MIWSNPRSCSAAALSVGPRREVWYKDGGAGAPSRVSCGADANCKCLHAKEHLRNRGGRHGMTSCARSDCGWFFWSPLETQLAIARNAACATGSCLTCQERPLVFDACASHLSAPWVGRPSATSSELRVFMHINGCEYGEVMVKQWLIMVD